MAVQSMQATDEISPQWLEQVRQRDESATRQLVERLYPLVLRVVRAAGFGFPDTGVDGDPTHGSDLGSVFAPMY